MDTKRILFLLLACLMLTPLFAAYRGVENALRVMAEEGIVPSAHHPEMVCGFKEYTNTVGLPEVERIRKEFAFQ